MAKQYKEIIDFGLEEYVCLAGDVEALVEKVNKWWDRYGGEYHKLALRKEYHGYDGGEDYFLDGTRFETDRERNTPRK